ncbi:RNA-directed DNA polymerase (reverse transcriptase)-related family protein [Rhynchospora pubera]|uniref:RNA-directed DNA polymerase (Reverse transcriptase)-related family protein n=1 Tax=Rhynchospora pubera TaxID=906938 RepID=A0AAV8EZ15_9POAL|nr:RNA-directed DNA polymerase (reverse transcriptase)-related family protein [Rhynchospora pubera]
MDVLTRMLMQDTIEGKLKGVQLSRNGPVLNTFLYADDLLIFGEASVEEVQRVVLTLAHFCAISGQQIGHCKSKVWFSQVTPQPMRNYVMNALNASSATPTEVYLGSHVAARSPSHFQPLVNRIKSKLQGWKATFLSPAGKLTLIKAVIEPMLLHAMSTATLPKKTLNTIQSRIRSFFWSSKNQNKMPMVAWNKITRPKMCGGVGLRDLAMLNTAFNLKCLWKLASNSTALWVQLSKAKYLKDESFGDELACKVFGQPWHDLWRLVKFSSGRQKILRVSDLLSQTGEWDNEKLIQEFGFATALFIAISVRPPIVNTGREDKLIFSYARNGQFTLRKAYQLVASEATSHSFHPDILKIIWHTPDILPRVRLFLWKALHNSLPLGDTIGRRIANVARPCALCGFPAETLQHALFTCPWARALWLASSLGMRTDMLPDNVPDLLSAVLSGLDECQTYLVANHLWVLWKLRCKKIYEGKKAKPEQFLSLVASYEKLQVDARLLVGRLVVPFPDRARSGVTMCQVDGSFYDPSLVGWAYLLADESGSLKEYEWKSGYLSSALHAEIMALQHAATLVINKGITECVFNTDCITLSKVINNLLQADQLEWRVFHNLLNVMYLFKTNPGFSCVHVPRNRLVLVDGLAKYARQNRFSYVGFTFPILPFESYNSLTF